MKEPVMHFDGPVWRPPYEATSQLLQVTAGCTWHLCKFCTLYGKQRFRMSPMSEIESDLKVIHQFQPRARRIFLTGANPFVLTINRLTDIALLYYLEMQLSPFHYVAYFPQEIAGEGSEGVFHARGH